MSDAIDAIGCIYALTDPGVSSAAKIGKDQKWPQRLRQAQSHTPRGMTEVGRWPLSGDLAVLANAERKALSLFPRESSSPGREWVRASSEEAFARISEILGPSAPPTSLEGLKPYDDWRDWERPASSNVRRRIWIGCEGSTGRLKIVHTRRIEHFRGFCPTYSRHGIRWLEAWGWPDDRWSPMKTLHPLDARLVNTWTELVTLLGFGPRDARVGWLLESVGLEDVRARLRAEGLQEDAGVGTNTKP